MLKWIKEYFENRDKRIMLLDELRILNEALFLIEYYYRKDDIDTITDKNGTKLKDIIKGIKEEISIKLAKIMTKEDED